MREGKITKIPLEERKRTFREVSLGFTQEEALIEARRCLQCKNPPCREGCPAGIDIKEFIRLITDKDYCGAIKKIKETNNLPGVCGRVCPQEDQCQVSCILDKKGKAIKIGYLERYVADWELQKGSGQTTKAKAGSKDLKAVKVAVIGSGPGGLSCAADLAKEGFDVYLFEALHKAGGVLVYGIPEFRLPKIIVEKEVGYIKSLGVKVITDFVAGRTKTIQDLRQEGFAAFFIGVGAGLPRFLNIPGENLNGVYSANEFLTRVNLMKSYRFPEYDTPVKIGRKIGVFGAGNVSFDCARCALRLGAEQVSIIYRRTRDEMPAREEEIENAQQEGVKFNLLVSPKEILSDGGGNVRAVRCIKNMLGDPDSSGRRSPVPIKGSQFTIDLDTVIVAVGSGVNPLLISTIEGLKLTSKGYIKVNENCQTSIPDIFAGGDIVSGSATVISAIAQAKNAAQAIKEFLVSSKVSS
ncbi:MAG: NADPH-dependent glutamate synthase [Candidatus Omnitrophota bacterium]|nr:MAG: NADPH-dependent glutamate synthase [Candidatus Omnitrophota bacterium]